MTPIRWSDYGLSDDAIIRFGQLSCSTTPEAFIWAVRGEAALIAWLTRG